MTSKVMVDKIKLVCDNYWSPDAAVTDNGPQFISRGFRGILKSRDILHYTTSVYHPDENGLVEVFNKTFKHGVQTFGDTMGSRTPANLQVLQTDPELR